MMGHKFPLLIPKTKLTKSPPNMHHYATVSKGRHPLLSLNIPASVGSSGLRPSQAQRVTFCSWCTGKSLWI